jgi:hypothetical protein
MAGWMPVSKNGFCLEQIPCARHLLGAETERCSQVVDWEPIAPRNRKVIKKPAKKPPMWAM